MPKKTTKITKIINKSRHKTLSRQGYVLSKSELTDTQLKKVKKDLLVIPKVDPNFNDGVEGFNVYHEDKRYIYIPRYYGIKNFGPYVYEDPLAKVKIDVIFKGKLRDSQKSIADECIGKIMDKGGGILSLPTGYGKTVLALYIAVQLGVKTCVLVNKTFLQNQWYERIKYFTNARIGMIRQNKTDVENKDIIIGMLQSVSMIDYEERKKKNIFDDIGLLIVDECHHNASRVFSQAFFKIGAKYTIGLSATPERNDGLTKVLHWNLGELLVKIIRKGDRNVLIKSIKYESTNELSCEKKRWFKGKVNPDSVKMITNMYKIKERNDLLVDIIYNLLNQYERKILILSGRIEHLNILREGVNRLIKRDVEKGIIEPDEFCTSLYIGKMKEYELDDASEAEAIFASYAMAEEGLDIDKLNTLLFATPKKNIIQSIGRIMRKPIKDGDINPMIIDIIDNYSIFRRWGDLRNAYYEKCKYKIDPYHAFNDKIIGIKEYLTIKGSIRKKNNDQNLDLRKEYITFHEGEDAYKLEEEFGFEDNDKSIYEYDPNLAKIFNTDNEKIIEQNFDIVNDKSNFIKV